MNFYNEGWSSLKHGGLLISANKLTEYFPETLPSLNHWQVEQLRRAVTAFDGTNASLGALLDYMLQDLAGFPADQWQKAQSVESQWSIRSFTGALVKPRRIWCGPNGEVLPVFVPEEGATRQFGGRLGVGRSRKLLSRVTEWLRRQHLPFGLVTNGRQWRLVHAGSDFESWCEWDIEFWFEEGEPSAQTLAWRTLINPQNFLREGGQSARLHKAVNESRKGQAELSAVLGERVRQSVENLISASQATIETAKLDEKGVDYNDLYVAGSRIIMRCIVTLFAEARQLLPVDNTIYQQAYSLEGLRQQLDRRSGGRGSDRLTHGRSAWPRLIALFNLIYHGSAHQAIPVPHYGGALFEPGDPESSDPISKALAVLESQDNLISDQQVLTILRLLTRTRVKIRQGNRNTWVDGPVNFSALSSEYIGILYEGLLDFELKRASTHDPVIFLGIGNQPALALSQLEQMDDKTIKKLFEELKKKDSSAGDDGGDEEPEAELEEGTETEVEEEGDNEAAPDSDEVEEPALTEDHLERAQEWLEKAAVLAGVVKKPRGKRAKQSDGSDELKRAAKQLCAKMIAPGQFYLVRWGGTRKGAGTFYTRPQLAAPTVRRTLQPLVYEGLNKATDPRTGLEEFTQWVPRTPEEILALKVCDPAMGSGSFLVGALRYLTDALVESLFHHEYVKPAEGDREATLDEERISALLSDELLKLRPSHEGFEETLRAQLKRHVVERCLYGVDIDPLAVELGRMALWVETMDRDLPFGFLDHKLKAGNALVGAWFDTYREYPSMAWQREGGDKDYQKGKPDNLINHYYVKAHTSGKNKGQQETKGDVFTDAIKERGKAVSEQLIAIISGQVDMDERLPAADVHDELLKVFRKLHRLPVHESDKRAEIYREQILKNPHYHELKARMDLWCALWFWPGESIESAPLPQDFLAPSGEALTIAQRVAQTNRFFHWELEYPDVFTAKKSGFDVVLGNPPWEIHKPNSKEFFSNYDPLYRAYGKQEALGQQLEYFGSNPELEHSWIQYNAGFKAMSNWAKYVGVPFGDRVTEDNKGKKKHDLNLGAGGRNSFENSEQMHKRWRKRRKSHKGFADSDHPFLHQGSADLNTYKMFLEQSHAIMEQAGRLGMIVPSSVYTDRGTTDLRTLFLEQCDWQWLFGFENREGIFDIHRSFKFCPLIVQKGGGTKAIRAAFMHRNVDDWEQAESYVLAYPRERVIEFSPYSKSVLEIRSNKDLQVLKRIYENGVLLGDQGSEGWSISYGTEFHSTNDSKFFPEREKWESKGYLPDDYGNWIQGQWKEYKGEKNILAREPGLILSRDGEKALFVKDVTGIALPLYEGRMIGQYDFSEKGWVSGKSRSAVWESIPFDKKIISPQYLCDYRVASETPKVYMHPKIAYMRVGSATNSRTAISTYLNTFPASDSVFFYRPHERSVTKAMVVSSNLNSFAYDFHLRNRVGGLNLSEFIMNETALVKPQSFILDPSVLILIVKLMIPSRIFAATFLDLVQEQGEDFKALLYSRSWFECFALTRHERLRVRTILDALYFRAYGLDSQQVLHILHGCDLPDSMISDAYNSGKIEAKGFWRVDRKVEPELRHPILSLIALFDLEEKGLDHFLSQNDGDGWLIPETLRLADYGLGHDDRAQEHQPVASRLGPRFYDWQLNEDVDRSWEECAAHAELIRQIVPEPESADEVAEDPAEYQVESTQGALF